MRQQASHRQHRRIRSAARNKKAPATGGRGQVGWAVFATPIVTVRTYGGDRSRTARLRSPISFVASAMVLPSTGIMRGIARLSLSTLVRSFARASYRSGSARRIDPAGRIIGSSEPPAAQREAEGDWGAKRRERGGKVSEATSFPPPWTVDETSESFCDRDANGQALAYVYF